MEEPGSVVNTCPLKVTLYKGASPNFPTSFSEVWVTIVNKSVHALYAQNLFVSDWTRWDACQHALTKQRYTPPISLKLGVGMLDFTCGCPLSHCWAIVTGGCARRAAWSSVQAVQERGDAQQVATNQLPSPKPVEKLVPVYIIEWQAYLLIGVREEVGRKTGNTGCCYLGASPTQPSGYTVTNPLLPLRFTAWTGVPPPSSIRFILSCPAAQIG